MDTGSAPDWRKKAEQALAEAVKLHDPRAKTLMLVIAASYVSFAEKSDDKSRD